MKISRLILPMCLFLLIITFISCSESGSSTPTSRNIVVTLRNLEDQRAVHIYFETEQPAASNLVNPQSSIETTIIAHRVGHRLSVYVKDASDLELLPLETTNVVVTEASYNSGTAEVHWTGTELQFIGW
jgi:hypothetical protein